MAQRRTDSIEELAAAYREADVFVNPTMEDNFPTANLEALSCGTPVVTFQTGGSPETIGLLPEELSNLTKAKIQKTFCGVCVEKGNGQALAEAVRLVCEHKQRGTERGQEAKRAGVLQQEETEFFGTSQCLAQASYYEKNEQYDKYFALYERLLKE